MATQLSKYTDAYATMTLAVYEPLILKWVSGWSIHQISSVMAWRAQKGKYLKPQHSLATAQSLNTGPYRPILPPDREDLPLGPTPNNCPGQSAIQRLPLPSGPRTPAIRVA